MENDIKCGHIDTNKFSLLAARAPFRDLPKYRLENVPLMNRKLIEKERVEILQTKKTTAFSSH